MNPKISVLVPIYNVESYIKRCVNSVLRQCFTDWELILVDDGSPDDSPTICDEYAKNDARISVIHKKNGGLPSARLCGFKAAKGSFLVFLDADDWLYDNALQILYDNIISDGGYDIVKSVVCREKSSGDKWIEHYQKEAGMAWGEACYLKLMQGDLVSPYLHSGIYRKELFSEKVFLPLIDNRISVGEDWFVNYYISPQVHKVKFISEMTFAYFVNEDSMMGGSVYGWDYFERVEQCKNRINKELNILETEEYLTKKALLDLRYFFFPEVPFNWKYFKKIRPLALKGIELQKRGMVSSYNPKFTIFLSRSFLFYIYTVLFRFFFLLFKLKGKKRKVVK